MSDSSAWLHPITVADYLALPGVVDVEEHEGEPGVATLVVRHGCHGVARILMASGVTTLGLELREEVQSPLPGETSVDASADRWRAFTDIELRALAYSLVWHDNECTVLAGGQQPYCDLMAEIQAEAERRGFNESFSARQFPDLKDVRP